MRRSVTVHVDTFTVSDVDESRLYVVVSKHDLYFCTKSGKKFRWQGIRQNCTLTTGSYQSKADAVQVAMRNGWTVYEFDNHVDFAEHIQEVMP